MAIADKLKRIKEAENAFEGLIKKSQRDAGRLIDKAEKDAQQRLQQEVAEARKEAEEFLLMAEKETQKKVNQIESQSAVDGECLAVLQFGEADDIVVIRTDQSRRIVLDDAAGYSLAAVIGHIKVYSASFT